MKDVLQELSCHYSTLSPNYLEKWCREHPDAPAPPKQIPDKLVDRLIERRYANRGLYYLFQLYVFYAVATRNMIRRLETLTSAHVR